MAAPRTSWLRLIDAALGFKKSPGEMHLHTPVASVGLWLPVVFHLNELIYRVAFGGLGY